jgi:perosamine synthetase
MPFSEPGVRATAGSLAVFEPTLAGNEWLYVAECLETGWVSSVGAFVDRFEQAVAEYTGARHAVATVNGTAALHVALLVAGVRPEDLVLVPTLTFIAPVNAVRYCGAEPVFLDADPATCQLDVEKLARFLEEQCEMRGATCYHVATERVVRAIVPVHLLGCACSMDRILTLSDAHGLAVVEDAAKGWAFGGTGNTSAPSAASAY